MGLIPVTVWWSLGKWELILNQPGGHSRTGSTKQLTLLSLLSCAHYHRQVRLTAQLACHRLLGCQVKWDVKCTLKSKRQLIKMKVSPWCLWVMLVFVAEPWGVSGVDKKTFSEKTGWPGLGLCHRWERPWHRDRRWVSVSSEGLRIWNCVWQLWTTWWRTPLLLHRSGLVASDRAWSAPTLAVLGRLGISDFANMVFCFAEGNRSLPLLQSNSSFLWLQSQLL